MLSIKKCALYAYINSDKQFKKIKKMETNKNEKKEIRTNGFVMKNFVNFVKLASIPTAIIVGAFVLKKGIGNPLLKLHTDIDFLYYILAEKRFGHCPYEDF